jgi:hypothetical protein
LCDGDILIIEYSRTSTLAALCHIATLTATIGLIGFIEWNVTFAEPYLQGGSEDAWGFGQIFALVALVVPLLELVEHALSRSNMDGTIPARKRWRYWIDESIMPLVTAILNGKSL